MHLIDNPGPALREIIEANRLNVSRAAKLLNVTRPTLSNLLNGKAALSKEMAQRFATAFPAAAEAVLALHASQDQAQNREQAKELMVRTYTPHFLGITAGQIQAWSDNSIAARDQFPALLRRLVNGAGISLTKIDFPAFDNAQRAGWDGMVGAEAASPWVPRGNSGWEFGCDKNPAAKAEKDYQNRRSLPEEERAEQVFVFVSPRNWPAKEKWARAKRKENVFRDVRVLDASDLEQWLEQCPAAQAWFAELIGSSQLKGLKSLERAWTEWANATTPPLSKRLFRLSVETKANRLQDWLDRAPGEPLIIAADSEGEAVAFIACALEGSGQTPGKDFDGTLIVQTVEALRRIAVLGARIILITSSPEVEKAYAGLANPPHLIVARRRNSLIEEPTITLDLVDEESFRTSLEAMGLHRPDFGRYSAETANSPTILRRRLAKLPALKTPAWSTDESTARALIPIIFAGAWDTDKSADLEVMRCLTDLEPKEIEKRIRRLDSLEDAPTWSIGKFRGVTSKIDALFATHRFITQDDIKDFLLVAQIVLSEEDPAQDLPREQQWAAGVYGKTREHSSVLRRGLCETLVLLAAHGNSLLRPQLNLDVEAHVGKLVRDLLTPLDGRTWRSQRRDLPRYAEAAPEVFLDILEQDLASGEPKVLSLMQPADSTLFGDCHRSGLLWALERLAWNPGHLLRVSRLLARLSEIHISDNWANTPKASLDAIYRSWMPQTSASIEQRNMTMEMLCREYQRVGWRLIIGQFGSVHAVGQYSARPEWRNDASGAGEPVKTQLEIDKVAAKARALALAWPSHDENTFTDIIERMAFMPLNEQHQIWDAIIAWAEGEVGDEARHRLRERIGQSALTRRASIRGLAPASIDRAREAYRALAPKDLAMRHLWLFEQPWVAGAPDDDQDDEYDFDKHETRIAEHRLNAIREIWTELGFDGILRLNDRGNAGRFIGWNLCEVLDATALAPILERLVQHRGHPEPIKIDAVIVGFLLRLNPDQRATLLASLTSECLRTGDADAAVRLLKCAPCRSQTWEVVSRFPPNWQQRFWHETYVQWEKQSESELNFLIEKLIDANRSIQAFSIAHLALNQIETKLMVQLLQKAATSSGEPEQFRLEQYWVSQAFKTLVRRSDCDESELLQLEILYIEALERDEYGLPILERSLAKRPELFSEAVAAVFKRSDGGEDPPEWVGDDDEQRLRRANVAYKILRHFTRLPGMQDDGNIDAVALRQWVDGARALGAGLGRASAADIMIGEMLGRSSTGTDGIWPSNAVREVLDGIASEDMARGVSTGRYNSRGVQWRAPGGGQERDLALQYQKWADGVAYLHPFTAKLLRGMAQQYDREAQWHDNEDDIRKRTGH